METLAEAILREQERCRELLKEYAALGPVGVFGMTMIQEDLKTMEVAVMSGDLAAMLKALAALKGCK